MDVAVDTGGFNDVECIMAEYRNMANENGTEEELTEAINDLE